MKILEQKISKLEKERLKKVNKRNELNEEIFQIDLQLKELNKLENQYKKLNSDTEKILKGFTKNHHDKEKNETEKNENLFQS